VNPTLTVLDLDQRIQFEIAARRRTAARTVPQPPGPLERMLSKVLGTEKGSEARPQDPLLKLAREELGRYVEPHCSSESVSFAEGQLYKVYRLCVPPRLGTPVDALLKVARYESVITAFLGQAPGGMHVNVVHAEPEMLSAPNRDRVSRLFSEDHKKKHAGGKGPTTRRPTGHTSKGFLWDMLSWFALDGSNDSGISVNSPRSLTFALRLPVRLGQLAQVGDHDFVTPNSLKVWTDPARPGCVLLSLSTRDVIKVSGPGEA